MSTIAYAALTARREDAAKVKYGTNAPKAQLEKAAPAAGQEEVAPSVSSVTPNGVSKYVDVLAGLVPAEVLAAHAAILTFTTMTTTTAGVAMVSITQPGTLQWVFYALVALSALLYIVAHWSHWDALDFIRMLIPPLAFIGWTMLQQVTAFDAVLPNLSMPTRYAVAVIGAVILSGLATLLAYGADKKGSKTAGRTK